MSLQVLRPCRSRDASRRLLRAYGGVRPRRHGRAPSRATLDRDSLRHRRSRSDALRQARRRARKASCDRARCDRDRGRARARSGVDPVGGRLRRHGAGAPGRCRAGAGTPGGDRRGIPKEVPADTINKVCASSIRAIELADLMIRAGQHDVVVTGGMESMSKAPYLLPSARFGYRLGNGERPRPHGLRRAHIDVRRRPHGRPGVAVSHASSGSHASPRTRGLPGRTRAPPRRRTRAGSRRRSSPSATSSATRASAGTRPSRSWRR